LKEINKNKDKLEVVNDEEGDPVYCMYPDEKDDMPPVL